MLQLPPHTLCRGEAPGPTGGLPSPKPPNLAITFKYAPPRRVHTFRETGPAASVYGVLSRVPVPASALSAFSDVRIVVHTQLHIRLRSSASSRD